MKFLKVFTILFVLLSLMCMGVIWYTRSNDITPSPLYVFGAIFCPIMALITRGAEIEEKEQHQKNQCHSVNDFLMFFDFQFWNYPFS